MGTAQQDMAQDTCPDTPGTLANTHTNTPGTFAPYGSEMAMGRGTKFHLLGHWKPSECSLTTIHWIHESSLPVPKQIESFVGLAWCSVEAVFLSFLHRDGERAL